MSISINEKEKSASEKASISADYLIESYLCLFGDCVDKGKQYNIASIWSWILNKFQKDLSISNFDMHKATSLTDEEWEQKAGYNVSSEQVHVAALRFAKLCRLAISEEPRQEINITLSDSLDSVLNSALREMCGINPKDIIKVLELSLDHWKTKFGEI